MTQGQFTEGIIKYISEASFNFIPTEVVEHSKIVVLDTIGAIIAASNPLYLASRIIVDYVRAQEGKPDATVIGCNLKSTSANAALANGTMGYLCDIESYHVKAILHETVTVLAAALASAEKVKTGGKDFLTAFNIGIDLETRLSYAVSPSGMYARGFHPSAVMGVFGAAVSAGKLLNLTPKQHANALGIAAVQSSGLLAWEGDRTEMSRPFGIGAAARNGVTAAELASKGFGGPEVLEGKYTLFNAFSGEAHPEEILADLGTRFEVMNQTFKRYSSCAFTHPGLDALFKILIEHEVKGVEIKCITIRFPAKGAKLIDRSELKSHNIQYIFSVASYNRSVTVNDILFKQSDSRILDLTNRVELIYDKTLDSYWPDTMPTKVTLKTKSGDVYEERIDSAKGTPENPLTHQDVRKKYHNLVSTVILPEKAKEIENAVDRLDQMSDISELTELLRFDQ